MGRPKKGQAFNGCEEDCQNCPYPDCYKPIHELKASTELTPLQVENKGKQQSHMYTLELGGVGKNMPNLSKKFYL